jgi:hypothetical protein
VHNLELHNFHASPNTIKMTKSRTMVDGTCSMHRKHEKYIQGLFENLKRSDYLEDLIIDGQTLLEWVLGEIRWEAVDWFHLARVGTTGGLLQIRWFHKKREIS